MKKVVVCGSIAYDNIMQFPGLFKDHILPDKIHTLSISFVVDSFTQSRGGTAPNIAYSMALLGLKPIVFGTAGKDFMPYKTWLEENGVDTSSIRMLDNDFTASCYIMTDNSDNQITSFYPGAMAKDPELSLKNVDLTDVGLVVIAPADPTAIVKWAKECREIGVPYMFDPGMSLPRLTGEQLHEAVLGASFLVVNEYEYPLLCERTGLAEETILEHVDVIVNTFGKRGSAIITKDKKVMVTAAEAACVIDPTGAGDAYKAGLVKGYFDGSSLEEMGRYGSVSAVYAIEQKGCSSHRYTLDEFLKRYAENYGEVLAKAQ